MSEDEDEAAPKEKDETPADTTKKTLPPELREFAKYGDCVKFAKEFAEKEYAAAYRRIVLSRRTTSKKFELKEHDYCGHSWIEYEDKLFMAYSGYADGHSGSYTVEEHFQKNTLTPDELHDIIIEFKKYCVNVTRNRNSFNIMRRFDPNVFIKKVDSYHRRMFHVGVSKAEKDKLERDFNLANDASTFNFEIKVFDINDDEVNYSAWAPDNFNGGKTFKKIKYKIRKSTERKGQTKRRRPTKRRKSKRRKSKKRKTKRT